MGTEYLLLPRSLLAEICGIAPDGEGNNRYRPNSNITREELAAMLLRYHENSRGNPSLWKPGRLFQRRKGA